MVFLVQKYLLENQQVGGARPVRKGHDGWKVQPHSNRIGAEDAVGKSGPATVGTLQVCLEHVPGEAAPRRTISAQSADPTKVLQKPRGLVD
jgi:hypothetical protein